MDTTHNSKPQPDDCDRSGAPSRPRSDIHIIRVHAPENIRTRVHSAIIRSRELLPLTKMMLIHLLDQSRAGEVHDTDYDAMRWLLGSGPPSKRYPRGMIGEGLLKKLIKNAKQCGFLRIEQPNSIVDGMFVTHWYVAEQPGEFHWGTQMGLWGDRPDARPSAESEPTDEAGSPSVGYPPADNPTADLPTAAAPTPLMGMGARAHSSHPIPARAPMGASEPDESKPGNWDGSDGKAEKVKVAELLMHWFGQGDKALLTIEDAKVLERAYFGDETVLSIDILKRCGMHSMEANRFACSLKRRRIVAVLKFIVKKLMKREAVKDLPALMHTLLEEHSKGDDYTEVGLANRELRENRRRRATYGQTQHAPARGDAPAESGEQYDALDNLIGSLEERERSKIIAEVEAKHPSLKGLDARKNPAMQLAIQDHMRQRSGSEAQ